MSEPSPTERVAALFTSWEHAWKQARRWEPEPLEDLEQRTIRALEEAVAEERAACARVAEEVLRGRLCAEVIREACAAAIRARGGESDAKK